jgi:hypothetical protein
MSQYQIAQVNIGRIKAPLDDPTMSGFMNRLDELNALADRSPGFVWRCKPAKATPPTSVLTTTTIASC